MDMTTVLLVTGFVLAFVLTAFLAAWFVQKIVDGMLSGDDGDGGYNIPYEQKSTEHA